MKKILFSIIMISMFISTNNVSASTQDNVTIVLRENSNGENIYKHLLKYYSENQINYLKEVNIINIKTNNLNGIKNTENKYKDEIIDCANLLKITKNTLDVPDNLQLQDSRFNNNNWYLNRLTDNKASLKLNKGNHKMKIGLIDSGVDINHPLLKNSIDSIDSKNFVENEDSSDLMGHGTMVAGIINSISPKSTITSYKVMGKSDGESIWVIKAIIEATNNNNEILNLSLGTYKSQQKNDEMATIISYKRAIQYARSKGVIVVGSIGNEGYNLNQIYEDNNILELPGGLDEVISVSSTMKNKDIAPYSNKGSMVDFSAPAGFFGSDFINDGVINLNDMIVTTYPIYKEQNNFDKMVDLPKGYTLSFGTSLSAPQVTASIANIKLEYKKRLKSKPSENEITKYLIKGTTDLGPIGKDEQFGYGEINIHKSLLSIINDSKNKSNH